MNAATATNSESVERSGRDTVLSRLRYLGEATGVNFTDAAQEVLILTKLRNAFAHADGLVMNDDDRRSIELWIQNHPDLADATSHAIRLKAGFVRHCIATYDRKLTGIADAVVAKMRTKSAPQQGRP